MAYPSVNFLHLGQHIGLQPVSSASLTQQHPLGMQAWAADATYGDGGFLYLMGAASTAPGDVVVYSSGSGETVRAQQGTTTAGSIAVAMSACTEGLYGWYQVSGAGPAKAGTVEAGAQASLSSTAGQLDDNGAFSVLSGVVVQSAASGGFATVQLAAPSISPAPSSVFSLRSEGALGDGSDDSAAFVAAEAKAYAAGGVVEVPPGTYTALNLTTRVGIQGAGTLKLKAQAPAQARDAQPLLTVTADDVSISGVTFDGNRDNQTLLVQDSNNGRLRAALVQVGSANRTSFSGCHFRNSLHDCISNTAVYNSEVSAATVEGLQVTGCTFRNSIAGAVEFFGTAPADGSTTMTSGGLVFVGNYCQDMGGLNPDQTPEDTHYYGDVITAGWLKSATIVGNIFQTVRRAAIKVGVIVDLNVAGNSFRETHWVAVQCAHASPGASAVDYKGSVNISNNVFTGCANATPEDLNVGGAVYINGSATSTAWMSGALSINGNTITDCPSNGAQPRDAICIAGAAHYHNISICHNNIRHASRHGINVECFDEAHKETIKIHGNTVDCTGFTVTCAGIHIFSGASMTSGNRLKLLDIEDNTIVSATYSIKLLNDPVRHLTIDRNKFVNPTQEGIFWAETVTPLAVWIDDNRWAETSNLSMASLPHVSNVWVGDGNRGVVATGYMVLAGSPPAGFGLASAAPTFGWWVAGQEVRLIAPASGGYRGVKCTTSGWANGTAWATATPYSVGQYVNNGGNAYQAVNTATSAGVPGPTHTDATLPYDGGGTTGVSWRYIGTLAVFKTWGGIS